MTDFEKIGPDVGAAVENTLLNVTRGVSHQDSLTAITGEFQDDRRIIHSPTFRSVVVVNSNVRQILSGP